MALAGLVRSTCCGHTRRNACQAYGRKEDRQWAVGKHQIVEEAVCQLRDFFGLERHWAKTLDRLLTCLLAAKVAAYTCGQ